MIAVEDWLEFFGRANVYLAHLSTVGRATYWSHLLFSASAFSGLGFSPALLSIVILYQLKLFCQGLN